MPEISESIRPSQALTWWQIPSRQWSTFLKRREDQIFLVLTLLIGALVGLAVVAFIVLTEHAGLRIYPVGGAPWRRFLVPLAGSLTMGYRLFKYFPDARGSGVPQTKAALYARGGYISHDGHRRVTRAMKPAPELLDAGQRLSRRSRKSAAAASRVGRSWMRSGWWA